MPDPIIQSNIALAATKATAEQKAARRQKFEGVFTIIRDELIEHFKGEGMPSDAIDWYKRNLNHNVPGGKLNRGMSVVDSVEIMNGHKLTDEGYFRSAVLGWCVELLQAYFLVADDIMDQSFTRRSQPCWFRVDGVGNIAINDSFMLEAAIYYLLKRYFKREPYYVDLLELFLETTYKTEMGQLIDLITAPEDAIDLSKFSLEKHRLIVIYKTAYYSFYLPVALAMHVSHISKPPSFSPLPPAPPSTPSATPPASQSPYDVALSILIPLGEYFQVQDDFLDYSATPKVLGKVGTDIIDNKCSWCINTALALASPAQRTVLDENYGRKNAACEEKVKEVFEQLGLRERYKAYEEGAYAKILGLIEQVEEVEGGLRREVFTTFLNKIYKRSM